MFRKNKNELHFDYVKGDFLATITDILNIKQHIENHKIKKSQKEFYQNGRYTKKVDFRFDGKKWVRI